MNKNKRIIASLLAAVMLTTCFAVMNVSAMFVSPVEFDENNIILKTGVMTDTHFNVDNTTNDPRVKKAITEIQKLAGGAENLDAITISGDITDWKPDQDILRADKVFKEVLDPKNTELVMAIGNHDVYNSKGNGTQYNFFRDSTGDFTYKKPVEENTPDEITSGNYHTVINGVHFLTVYGIDGNHPQSSINWLDKHLKIATDDAPDKPAIVITHVIPSDTVYGSTPNERWSSTTIGPVLSKYPQSVVIAGHSHNTIVPETTLWQENYTAIHAGVVSSSRSNFAYMEIDKNGNVRYSRYYLNDG
ncbi:MAG: metallophosphoesterase, partial [Clostridia bacterium]